MYFDHISPTSSISTLSQLHVWMCFISHWIQFVLSIYSWVWSLPKEQSWPARDHTLEENWHSLLQNASSEMALQLVLGACKSHTCKLNFGLAWSCTSLMQATTSEFMRASGPVMPRGLCFTLIAPMSGSCTLSDSFLWWFLSLLERGCNRWPLDMICGEESTDVYSLCSGQL